MDSVNFEIHTFGCKVNTYDSGLLQGRFRAEGWLGGRGRPGEEPSRGPRVHVLNTCAVTKEATREAVRAARRIKAREPLSLVVVTGCAAQVDTEEFSHLPGVDLVVANSHKSRLPQLIRDYYSGALVERVHKSNIFRKEDLEPGGGIEAGHTRAFLKIQDGCDSFCTYCVIPFARGKSRSLTVDDVVARANELAAAGVREIVLTGVHIGDYRDGGRGLEDLVESVLGRSRVSRLRLSSLEPGEITDRLLDLYSDGRLCRHFHMSIQSACSKVLREMKRQYDARAVEDSLMRIDRRVPGSFVGMDVIAGFNGETETEFLETVECLDRLPWTRLHVFPYSERPGTFAARKPGGPPWEVRKARARRLRELSDLRLGDVSRAQVGAVKLGLSLRDGSLLTRDYWRVELRSPGGPRLNEEARVRVTGVRAAGVLEGECPVEGAHFEGES